MKTTGRHSLRAKRPVFLCLLLAAALTAFCLGGCTARERAGYSSIPQNTPSSWSMRPYGDLRN